MNSEWWQIAIFTLFLIPVFVAAEECDISVPGYFKNGDAQSIFINISDLNPYSESAVSVALDLNYTGYGYILIDNEWIHFSKYPIIINQQNSSIFYDEIDFKINGTTDNIKEGILKILLKNKNGSAFNLFSSGIHIFNESEEGFIELFCEKMNFTYIEVKNKNLLQHRFNPSFYTILNEKGEVYYRFPVLVNNDLLINDFCPELNISSTYFNVSKNETVRFGNLYDMELEIIIDDKIYPKIKHENIFKIINNDHKTGEKENIDVFVKYEIKNKTDNRTYTYNFTKKGINSYSATDTGILNLEEGEYEICGSVEKLESKGMKAVDPLLFNNFICKNIRVSFEKNNDSCSPSIEIAFNEASITNTINFSAKIQNFTKNSYLIKIISENIFTGEKEEFHFLTDEKENPFELEFQDYSIYNVTAEIIETTCNDIDTTDNKAYATLNIIESSDFGIDSFIKNETYKIGEKINFPVYFYNGLDFENDFQIKLSLKRQTKDGWEETEILNETEIRMKPFELSYFIFNWSIPNESITGYYKIQVNMENNETTRYSYSYFSIEGIPDMGNELIEIMHSPDNMSFGDIGSVLVYFYSGNYNNINATLVAYINKFLDENKTRYAAVDFDLTILQSKIYESMASVTIPIERGKHYYLSLPLFINPNCNGNYKTGLYRGYARLYLSENKRKYESADFILELKDGSGKLCNKQSLSGSSKTKMINIDSETENGVSGIKSPEKVFSGEEFEVSIDLENKNENFSIIEVYSYVFEGNKLLSLGFGNDEWGKSWTANKIKLELSPHSGNTIKLKNKVKEDVPSGEYTLRVRKITNGKKEDMDTKITVLKRPEYSRNENISGDAITENGVHVKTYNLTKNDTINKSDINLKEKSEYNGIPTGVITGKSFDISLLDIIIALLRIFI